MASLREDMFGTSEQERERFRKTAQAWMEAGRPLRLQLGFGRHPLRDFLNLDMAYRVLDGREPADFHENCFIFDWPSGLPLPDNCVDFVFHEDMFEHLTQQQQFELLAEIHRVLEPGRFHRINCPNIEYIMRAASDFSKGRAGVYDEWGRWAHVNVPTRASLEEQAKIVGYSKVHFNGKNQTVSGVWFRERRPGGQFDQDAYNIFADLEKGLVEKREDNSSLRRRASAWLDEQSEEDEARYRRVSDMVRLVEQGDIPAAAKICEAEAEEIDNSNKDSVHVAALRIARAQGRHDVALAHALRVNALNRYLGLDRPEWAYEVAETLESDPQHRDKAREIRERLHEVGSKYPQIYLRVLGKCAPRGDEPGADKVLEWLLARPIDDPALADRLAARLQAAGRNGEAAALCRRQLETAPDDRRLLSRLARLLILETRLSEAAPVLARLRSLAPQDEWAFIASAKALQALERPDEALALLDEFLALSPGNSNTLAMKARLAWKTGQRAAAAATARQAIEADRHGAVREAMEGILSKADC